MRKKRYETKKYEVFERNTNKVLFIGHFEYCMNYLRKNDPFDILDVKKHEEDTTTQTK